VLGLTALPPSCADCLSNLEILETYGLVTWFIPLLPPTIPHAPLSLVCEHEDVTVLWNQKVYTDVLEKLRQIGQIQ
jgi:hypothetical protein